MEAKECAEILRSFLRHREKMYGKEIVFASDDGAELDRGYFKKENDILYDAVQFALDCVEKLSF